MSDSAPVTIRDVRAEDFNAVRYLFEKVFAQPLSRAFWEWKYAANGVAVIAYLGDTPVAHYGGQFRDVWFQGQQVRCIQGVDIMVDSAARGTLKRFGMYYLIATHFLNEHIGYGGTVEFGYGFPNARIMRLSEYLGIQTSVGEILELRWKAEESMASKSKNFDWSNTHHQEIADNLDQAMRASLPHAIVGVRDFQYLKYRYFDNPNFSYDLALCFNESNTSCVGMIVYRIEHDMLLILDLIGKVSTFPNLITQARAIAVMHSISRVVAWLPKHHVGILDGTQPEIVELNVFIPTSVCTQGPDPQKLRNKWWLSAGDTDFK